jgi:nucleoside-diphosphate-sugar epimerase
MTRCGPTHLSRWWCTRPAHSTTARQPPRAKKTSSWTPAVKGTTEVLRGIQRVAAASVRRVVLTSSVAAVLDWRPENPRITSPRRVYTGSDWNPMSLAEVQAHPGDHGIAYRGSKTLAERAAWDFVAQQQPGVGFDLVTLCPPMIYGTLQEPAQVAGRPADLNQSIWIIYNGLLRPGLTRADPVPATGLHLYVDVRGCARRRARPPARGRGACRGWPAHVCVRW